MTICIAVILLCGSPQTKTRFPFLKRIVCISVLLKCFVFPSFFLTRQHGFRDQDTTVRRCLLRDGEQYRMDAEVRWFYFNYVLNTFTTHHPGLLLCRFWWLSRTLKQWRTFVASCWRSWTRVLVWERHSTTTVRSASGMSGIHVFNICVCACCFSFKIISFIQ